MKKHVLAMACSVAFVSGCAMMGEKEPTASATLEPRSGSNVRGTVTFTQQGDVVRVSGTVTGHSKGPKGFHIHAMGDCSAHDAMSAGGHFNPGGKPHGHPDKTAERHAGDLPMLRSDAEGNTTYAFESTLLTALVGGSFGQLVTRLRVVRTDGSGLPLSVLQALVRQVLVALVLPPLVFRPDGRGLHDIAVGSATVALANSSA